MKHKDPEKKKNRMFFQSIGSRKPGRGLTDFLGTGKKVEQLRKLRATAEKLCNSYTKKKNVTTPNSAAQLLQTRHPQAVRTTKHKGWCLRKRQSPGLGTRT